MEGREEEAAAPAPAPALLISYGDSKHSLYNVFENRYYNSSNVPMLQGKRVVGCCHGWLILLETQTNNCCLWNPNPNPNPSNSGQETLIIHLPPLQSSHEYNAALLTKPPTEPDCHIIVTSDWYHVGVSFCRIGDDAFNTQTVKNDEDKPSTLIAITSFKGRIYGLIDYWNALVTFEFSDKGDVLDINQLFEFGYILNSPYTWEPWPSYHLVPYSCDELWVVCKQNPTSKLLDSFEFWVFQVYLDRKELVKVASIGDRTLFISQHGNGLCCCSSANKTESNAIYYTRENGDCYVFSLDDGSTTFLPPSPALDLQHTAFWVQQHPLLLNNFHTS